MQFSTIFLGGLVDSLGARVERNGLGRTSASDHVLLVRLPEPYYVAGTLHISFLVLSCAYRLVLDTRRTGPIVRVLNHGSFRPHFLSSFSLLSRTTFSHPNTVTPRSSRGKCLPAPSSHFSPYRV
jgi:hypothetical protein